MKVKPVLALPEGLEVTAIEMIDEVLTIRAVSIQVDPCCPLVAHLRCGYIAAIHARSRTCPVVGSKYISWCRYASAFVRCLAALEKSFWSA